MRGLLRAYTVLTVILLLTSQVAPVFAQGTDVVHVGSAAADLLGLYIVAVGSVVAAIASWALYRFAHIKLEANARAAIETFVTNAAGGFLARPGGLRSLDINVGNPAIAELANGALERIPDALKQFGLGPEDIRERIVEKIGLIKGNAAPGVPVVPVSAAPPL